ncbi:MAG: succinyl-CoA synthetase subunit beta [Pelotomaculum sp. PtaB.Bin104]|nr:MAG: succinyl-CoA synthetase subunit beta [Pelotomaculum sp. PtaB.Bin104]
MNNSALRSCESMNYLFYPRSIAIIGASADPAKPGGMPLFSMIKNGFAGSIFPVNPNHSVIGGLTCYPSLKEVPGEVDLAVIAVSARESGKALKDCAWKGVKAAVVFTSGFAETGSDGEKLQKEMVELAHENNINLCGPNCMGIFNAQNAMTAGFVITELSKKALVPNFFGFISQSGGFGAILHDIAAAHGIGFTYFVSSGNEADLQFSDYLAYMVKDANTKVIGGYLEGVREGRKLFQAAEMALTAKKPVLLIKTGRHHGAAKAAASHTGALAGSDRVYNSFFKQKGIIRVEGISELMATLSLFANCNLPQGNRVGIIAGSGGTGVLAADKCAEAGLELSAFNAQTQEALSELLPAFASAANPVDITSRIFTSPTLLRETTSLLLEDPGVDMLLVLHWTSNRGLSHPTRGIADLLSNAEKPVMVLAWGEDEAVLQDLHFFQNHQIPAVRELDYAVRSLAALARYSSKVNNNLVSAEYTPGPSPDWHKTADLLENLKPDVQLSEFQGKEILQACGIPTTREGLARSKDEAVQIASNLGYPVVLKIDSPDIPHKTEAGGVKTNLDTPDKVEAAFTDIINAVKTFKPDARIRGIQVQEMLTGGIEIIAGINRDPVFGPVILFGLGGIFVEALADISLRVAPLTITDAREMIQEIKGFRVLSGLRGAPPADLEAIVDVLLKLSRLALDYPQITELDINPLFVFEKGRGVKAADVLIIGN